MQKSYKDLVEQKSEIKLINLFLLQSLKIIK